MTKTPESPDGPRHVYTIRLEAKQVRWIDAQPGGFSRTIRRLIDEAMKADGLSMTQAQDDHESSMAEPQE